MFVVYLLRELFTGQLVEVDQFGGERLRGGEAFGEEHDLGDESVVRHHHGDRTEERLQVVWQLHPAGVAVQHTGTAHGCTTCGVQHVVYNTWCTTRGVPSRVEENDSFVQSAKSHKWLPSETQEKQVNCQKSPDNID